MNYTRALSASELQCLVPSAFATEPHTSRSKRYAFIPTSNVIEGMCGAGFIPVQASQSRTRIADKKGYTKHLIRFRQSSQLNTPAIVDDSVLEVVLINSHDGTSRYKLICGVFRFVCTNGMLVADSTLESVNIMHTGNVIGEVIDATQHIFDNAPKVVNAIQQWNQLQLTAGEQVAFADAAHTLRFGETDDGRPQRTDITSSMLLKPRRSDDNGADLWHTFNRVQENATKGFKALNPHPFEGEYGYHRYVRSRAVKGIDGDVKLNRALWTLAERMAELKRAV